MQCGALHVAMAVRPDLGLHAGTAEERVVGGHRAVRTDPHDLAEPDRQVLRPVAVREPVPLGDEGLVGKDEPGPEMV